METTSRTRTTPLPVREEGGVTSSNPSFVDRLQTNPALAIRLGVIVLVVAAVALAGVLIYQHRSNAASQALADAMETYDTPLSTPTEPLPPGQKSFPSLEARAKAANAQFKAIADSYGMTEAGRNALYLEGVTAAQAGENQTAEDLLKKSAGSWSHDVATLSQVALAGLYRSTGRESLAIETLQKVIDKPSTVVPKGEAQLQLAELYEANGKTDQAKKIYAQIKDKDPKSAAAEIASQKLAGPEGPGAGLR